MILFQTNLPKKGQITNIRNSTIETYPKQLKDRWSMSNQNITLFNGIYNRLYAIQLSGTNDAILLEAAKESFRYQARRNLLQARAHIIHSSLSVQVVREAR